MTDKGGFQLLGGLLATAQILVLCDAQPAAAQANEGQRRAASAKMAPPVMLGWAERARIFPGNLPIQAKLDTGANTSSLNVEKYQIFDRLTMHNQAFLHLI